MGKEKTYKVKLEIPTYILEIVLPELSYVYGKTVSSVYLQILTHIYKKKNTSAYFKKNYVRLNSCFMKSAVYKEHIKYSQKSINKAMNILCDLNLIKEIKDVHVFRRFRVFELNNMDLKAKDVTKFLDSIEYNIKESLISEKREKVNKFFSNIRNVMISSGKSTDNKLIYRRSYEDAELLRTWLTETESIYKGSSLFFVLNILPYLYKANKTTSDEPIELAKLSSRQRALCSGLDDSTAWRIINKYKECGILSVLKTSSGKELYKLNETMVSADKICLVNKKDVHKEKVACPICGKEFASSNGVSIHISHQKDAVHKNYIEHRQTIKLEAEKAQKQILEQIKTVKCDSCLIKCSECHTEWKDEFKACNEDAKAELIKLINEYQKNVNISKRMKKIIDEPETNTLQVHTNENAAAVADVINKVTKKRKPRKLKADSAPGLVKYFYDTFGGNSPSWARECHQVKLLLDNGVEPDCIRDAMALMKKRGNNDLRYISGYSIADVVESKKLFDEANTDGTDAYYVKKYYDGLNKPFTNSDIVEDVKRVVRLRNERNVDNDKLKFIINYMIANKTPTFNFLDSQAKAALQKYNEHILLVGDSKERAKVSASDKAKELAKKYNVSINSALYLADIPEGAYGGELILSVASDVTKEIIAAEFEDAIFNMTYDTKKYNALDFAYMSRAYLTDKAFEFVSKIKTSKMSSSTFKCASKWLATVETI